jgi:hypothetical protein
MSLRDLPAFAHMRVCRQHAYPYDTVPNHVGEYQKCCDKTDEDRQRRWEAFDFNEWVYICACCTSEGVVSGHKFALFYCEECKDRIVEVRRSETPLAIPLGRHSLMNGIGLRGSDATKPAAAKVFADALNGMFGTISAISEWQRRRLLGILADCDEDPLLVDLLAEARRRWTKEEAFHALCAWWVTPDAEVEPFT